MKIKLHNFIAFTVLLASAIVGLCFYSEWSGMAEENQQLLEHRKQLQAQVDALQKDWENKNEYYNRLLSDPEFAERVIREKLGYAYPNDIVFRFKDSDPVDIADDSEKGDFDTPALPPKRKTLFEKIKEFFGFGKKEKSLVANNSKESLPELRIDMTNASVDAVENKKRLESKMAPTISTDNGVSQNALELPNNVKLISEKSVGTLQDIKMRSVKVKLGGTNASIRRITALPLKPVRFVSRHKM
ncbi:MAG: septum formation initiator family protein [Verrucomicrobiaceae bacterium]|nr:septum formation initiator family protein [Verrucomicrobiaceae bacterium]